MPSKTPVYEIPYPAPGDTLRSAVSTTLQALAERLETVVGNLTGYAAVPPRIVAKSEFMSGPTTSRVVTFPAGRFTAAPMVTATVTTGANVALIVNVSNVTTTQCTLFFYGVGGTWSAGAVSAYVQAIQAI